ncbi:hypothetical protein V8C86DRAFT_2679974 [Haematococcus lacustris]
MYLWVLGEMASCLGEVNCAYVAFEMFTEMRCALVWYLCGAHACSGLACAVQAATQASETTPRTVFSVIQTSSGPWCHVMEGVAFAV